MTEAQTRYPMLLALTLIATPVFFFLVLFILGPLANFALYLLLSWTIAAFVSAIAFALDHRFESQFSESERFAILAGNAAVACIVALMAQLTLSGVG